MTARPMSGERLMLERRRCGLSQLQLASWEQTGQPIPVGLVERITAALWIARQRQAQRDRERFSQLHPFTTRSNQP